MNRRDGSESPPLPVAPRRRRNSQDSVNLLLPQHDEAAEAEIKRLRRTLRATEKRLKGETQRANDAEKLLLNVAAKLKQVNNERVAILQDVSKATNELQFVFDAYTSLLFLTLLYRLYKMQLAASQREIYRAQDVVKIIDQQRQEAEKSAANARSSLRKMHDERTIQMAMEEGRQAGIIEGMHRAREYHLQQQLATQPPVSTAGQWTEGETTSVREDSGSESEDEETQPPSPVLTVTRSVARSDRSRQTMQTDRSRQTAPRQMHPSNSIPPDNFIPSMGTDSVIHLPPPHELSMAPPTPGTMAPSTLPRPHDPSFAVNVVEQAPSIRSATTTRTGGHRRRRSSPSSNSTTYSKFEIVNPSPPKHSPMSAITEVNSPNPGPSTIHSFDQGHSRHHSRVGYSSSWSCYLLMRFYNRVRVLIQTFHYMLSLLPR